MALHNIFDPHVSKTVDMEDVGQMELGLHCFGLIIKN